MVAVCCYSLILQYCDCTKYKSRKIIGLPPFPMDCRSEKLSANDILSIYMDYRNSDNWYYYSTLILYKSMNATH